MIGIPENDLWAIIVNLTAASGKCKGNWPEIHSALKQSALKFSCYFTENIGHASRITSDLLLKGYKKFVAVGGDGTLIEVADGILKSPIENKEDVILGQIAAGSGNDWRRTYNINDNFYQAVKRLEECKTILQDAGKVIFNNEHGEDETRYFLNVAGLGFDAVVTEKATIFRSNNKGGKMIYLYSLLNSLFITSSVKCRFEVDGVPSTGLLFNVSVGIGKYNGGGMKLLPDAIPDDGLFDLTIINHVSKLTVICNLIRIYKGTFITHPSVRRLRCTNFTISSDKTYGLELDGEFVGFVPAKFEVIKKCLRVVV
jgi:diacylglycerol kinase (ATP)